MINSVDDVNGSRPVEPHHVTFFAPDRPVEGNTVFAVDDVAEKSQPDRCDDVARS